MLNIIEGLWGLTYNASFLAVNDTMLQYFKLSICKGIHNVRTLTCCTLAGAEKWLAL